MKNIVIFLLFFFYFTLFITIESCNICHAIDIGNEVIKNGEKYLYVREKTNHNDAPEINIWLKRTDIAIGTYTFGAETYDTPPSHFIDLIDNSNEEMEETIGGTITITEVNTSSKIAIVLRASALPKI